MGNKKVIYNDGKELKVDKDALGIMIRDSNKELELDEDDELYNILIHTVCIDNKEDNIY